jgi:hypothetical protein
MRWNANWTCSAGSSGSAPRKVPAATRALPHVHPHEKLRPGPGDALAARGITLASVLRSVDAGGPKKAGQ